MTMKSRFVANGRSRLHECQEFNDRPRALRESIEARYAAELAEAGLFRRMQLRWRIAAEYRRERRKFAPSQYSLYGRHSIVSDSRRK
jgi:hypothetical protein